jgi:hypothetical protein
MPAKTTHIIPSNDGWVVKKERDNVFVKKQSDRRIAKKTRVERASSVFTSQPAATKRAKEMAGREKVYVQLNLNNGVYSTQKQAIDAARGIVRRSSAGQIVVHGRDGSISRRDIHGLPVVQMPPRKSKLGTKAIEKAVSTVIRERLERE